MDQVRSKEPQLPRGELHGQAVRMCAPVVPEDDFKSPQRPSSTQRSVTGPGSCQPLTTFPLSDQAQEEASVCCSSTCNPPWTFPTSPANCSLVRFAPCWPLPQLTEKHSCLKAFALALLSNRNALFLKIKKKKKRSAWLCPHSLQSFAPVHIETLPPPLPMLTSSAIGIPLPSSAISF